MAEPLERTIVVVFINRLERPTLPPVWHFRRGSKDYHLVEGNTTMPKALDPIPEVGSNHTLEWSDAKLEYCYKQKTT